ncbi:MAG: hypothetical protein R2695_20490 [Acidimicrobiales bacterium]
MSDGTRVSERQRRFWELAETFLAEPDVEEGTLMGTAVPPRRR